MVEAMLVIPFLIIVLTGAVYLRELYVARAETRLASRACAWAMAMKGCEGGAPAACSRTPSTRDEAEGPDIAANAKSHVGASDAANPFRDFPALGEAFDTLFGRSTRASASAEVPFPFDEKRVGVAHSETEVMCNSIRHEVLDMAIAWLKKALT